jgi:hypothetical protein
MPDRKQVCEDSSLVFVHHSKNDMWWHLWWCLPWCPWHVGIFHDDTKRDNVLHTVGVVTCLHPTIMNVLSVWHTWYRNHFRRANHFPTTSIIPLSDDVSVSTVCLSIQRPYPLMSISYVSLLCAGCHSLVLSVWFCPTHSSIFTPTSSYSHIQVTVPRQISHTSPFTHSFLCFRICFLWESLLAIIRIRSLATG